MNFTSALADCVARSEHTDKEVAALRRSCKQLEAMVPAAAASSAQPQGLATLAPQVLRQSAADGFSAPAHLFTPAVAALPHEPHASVALPAALSGPPSSLLSATTCALPAELLAPLAATSGPSTAKALPELPPAGRATAPFALPSVPYEAAPPPPASAPLIGDPSPCAFVDEVVGRQPEPEPAVLVQVTSLQPVAGEENARLQDTLRGTISRELQFPGMMAALKDREVRMSPR